MMVGQILFDRKNRFYNICLEFVQCEHKIGEMFQPAKEWKHKCIQKAINMWNGVNIRHGFKIKLELDLTVISPMFPSQMDLTYSNVTYSWITPELNPFVTVNMGETTVKSNSKMVKALQISMVKTIEMHYQYVCIYN